MKSGISRVYKNHFGKRSCTYTLTKQGKTTKKGLGNPKITNFQQGNAKLYHETQYNFKLDLISDKNLLVTEHSMESFRITYNRLMVKNFSKLSWYFIIRTRPHILLREHKRPASGPVDRISMGMRLAYGAPFARAAKLSINQTFMTVFFSNNCNLKQIKTVLQKSISKLAAPFKLKLTQTSHADTIQLSKE